MSLGSIVPPTVSIPVAHASASAPLQLRRPFVVLVLMLLLAVSASVGAGLVGLGHLDRSLREVTQIDVQRLIAVTHVRRLFRSEVVLSHAIEDTLDPVMLARLEREREKVREERAVQLDRLKTLDVLGQDAALGALQRDHELSNQAGHAAATNWENAVSTILNATRERLRKASLDAERTSSMARTQLVVVSGSAVALALLLGALVLRRVHDASESLSRSEEQFRTVVQSAPSLLTILSPEKKLVYLPPRAESFLGTSHARLLEAPLCWVDAEHVPVLDAQIEGALEGAPHTQPVRVTASRDSGSKWHASASVTPLYGARRQVTGIILQILDISDQVTAEEERRGLEEQLRQAQKMETVGRLAGGIAHDFNNLLTAIKGFASLAQQDPSGPDVPEFIESISTAADRAANLTHQLLAFSRKHIIAPVPTDLGALVRGIEKMLVRVIGEDVKLEVRSDDRLGTCLVDPNQVEQVVMNLAINARHAMPKGGSLLIETKNAELDEGYTAHHPTVPEGPYVLLSVSDTGVGMTKEVKSRAFEPFFTTKPVGQGTGLGLSVVYGTVQQHGGTVDIYSEVGLGTTFRIYWPRADLAGSNDTQVRATAARPRGDEIVLLVEDDLLVQSFASKTLMQLGYHVICADSATDARRVLDESAAAPGLLLTDMILSDGNGHDLAVELTARFPKLPVLFSSGYSDQLLSVRARLPDSVDYLPKPYDAGTLAWRVREAIDRGKVQETLG